MGEINQAGNSVRSPMGRLLCGCSGSRLRFKILHATAERLDSTLQFSNHFSLIDNNFVEVVQQLRLVSSQNLQIVQSCFFCSIQFGTVPYSIKK